MIALKRHSYILRNSGGSAYIDTVVLVLCAVLVLALAVKVLPVFVVKQQLGTFANELCREAELVGQVGNETDRREQVLRERIGIEPTVEWSHRGKIQLNTEFTVTATQTVNIGLFGEFGSFPITLRGSASGKSEVYWK